MNRKKLTALIVLHVLLAVYSVSGILSKMAGKTTFLGMDFCMYYVGIIAILGIYAVVWQQIIKVLPLTVAFANKAVTVIWGIIWGVLIFSEEVVPMQLAGVLLIVIGIVLYSTDKTEEEECRN